MKCIQCKTEEVKEELTRCKECEEAHKALCAELDARPKPPPAKKQEDKWIPANVPGGKLYFYK